MSKVNEYLIAVTQKSVDDEARGESDNDRNRRIVDRLLTMKYLGAAEQFLTDCEADDKPVRP